MTVSAYTPNFRLALIDFNSQNWHGDDWNNWLLIDALLLANFNNLAFATAVGTNTLTIDYTPNIPAYFSGQVIQFKLVNAPTGAVTINADGQGAKNLLLLGAPIVSGQLQANDIVRAIYDGTQFNVLDPIRQFGRLVLHIGTSGATVLASADDLTIESDTDVGISLLSPNTSIGSIVFGKPSNNAAGTITYNHSTNVMAFTALTGFSFNQTLTATFIGNLTGNVTGNVSGTAANVSGVVSLVHGGTGGTDAATARSGLGLGALAVLGSVNNANWSGTALTVGNGGTGATTVSAARSALGVPNIAGDTFTGAFGRDATFTLDIVAGNARLTCDTGDYILYDRTSNKYIFYVASTAVMSLDGSGNLKLLGNVTAATTP